MAVYGISPASPLLCRLDVFVMEDGVGFRSMAGSSFGLVDPFIDDSSLEVVLRESAQAPTLKSSRDTSICEPVSNGQVILRVTSGGTTYLPLIGRRTNIDLRPEIRESRNAAIAEALRRVVISGCAGEI